MLDSAHNKDAMAKSQRLFLELNRFRYIPNVSGQTARARGLGVMTLP